LTHAAKEKDEDIGRIVAEISGSGNVRNCPDVIVTKLF